MAEMIIIGFNSEGTPNSKRIDLTGKTIEQIQEEMTKWNYQSETGLPRMN